jgi:hypothetical protein
VEEIKNNINEYEIITSGKITETNRKTGRQ